MDIFKDIISECASTILYAVLIAIAGWLGTTVRNLYARLINDNTKRSVAKTCVAAVEQICKDLHGEEKLNRCIDYVISMLGERGITVTDNEVRLLIEAAVNEFNRKCSDSEG